MQTRQSTVRLTAAAIMLAVGLGIGAPAVTAQLNQPLHQDGWILAAAHAPGQHGSIWRTDLWVYLESTAPASLTLYFCESGQDNTGVQGHTITTTGEQNVLYLPDVVDEYLDVEDGSWLGAIHYTANRKVQVWARVYSVSPDGTKSYGQLIEGIASVDMSPDSDPWLSSEHQWLYAMKHTSDDRYRVNIGIVNPTAVDATYSVAMFDDGNSSLGGMTVAVRPYSMVQLLDPFASVKGGSWSDSRIRVACNTEGGGGFAYASVVDNATNDAYFVRGTQQFAPGTRLGMNCTEHGDGWILAAARAPGMQGSIWRTDLWIRASDTPSTTVTLRFCRSGEDGTAAQTHTITLGGEDPSVVYFEDVVGHFLGSEAASWVGAIHYTAAPAIQVWARVYSISPDGSASYGQLVEGIPTADRSPHYTTGHGRWDQWLCAARHTADDRFRVNVGIVNPTAVTTEYWVQMMDGITVLDDQTSKIAVPPYSMTQLADPFAAIDGGEWSEKLIRVEPITENGGGFAYASVVDNATNDAYFVRGIKLLTPSGE